MILLITTTVWAEGFDPWLLSDVTLLEETDIFIDIETASADVIFFIGEGTATLYDPNGNERTTLDGFGSVNSTYLADVAGRWRLDIDEDQPLGWEVGTFDPQNGTEYFGRISAEEWHLYAGPDDPLAMEFYVPIAVDNPYNSGDNVLYKVGLNGVSGDHFVMMANDSGGTDSPRWSIAFAQTAPVAEYNLYLSPPESEYADPFNIAPQDGTITYEGGSTLIPGKTRVTFGVTMPAEAYFGVICDIDGNGELNMSGHGDLVLLEPVGRGEQTQTWDGLDSDGNPMVEAGEYSCIIGAMVAPINLLIGEANTAWPGVQLFALDATYFPTDIRFHWNDHPLLDAMGDADGVEMPSGETALPHTTGIDGLKADYGDAITPNDNAHGWGNFSDKSRGDEGWVNTWGALGGGKIKKEFTLIVGDSDEPIDTGKEPDDSGGGVIVDTGGGTVDTSVPGPATLDGSFMGGVCRCSSAPAVALIWPLLVAIAARRRRP